MADSVLTDPLGRSITLRDRTWYGHIIKGHPDVSPYRRLVEQVIRQPEEIRVSSSDVDYRKYIGPSSRPAVKIIVIADVVRGIVKTAYLARSATGDIEWPSEPT